ncbi:arylsulfatase [Synechococcus sp. Tobar12-5m-g]|uniref:arylsulfatase n=1 Tax=unclassified Synechococcus TaxID=2626047 RepID=UPI0020CF4827|nr:MULTISPECIES: arylsulfatase [unclassified Synechococcus]MCP9773464.1 arylsulfatase [Synechococcus sp. Tobar12-5m-g]MCP9874436.1 arylsulfatase [Synechococcus sp. Cruz CV-v-12]
MRHPWKTLAVAVLCLLLSSGVITGAWARPTASATASAETSAKAAASPAATPTDGSVLPFPPVPSASIARPRLQDSVHKRRAQPQHLKADAPNVLIVLLDDVGFGQASTFGGEINTPTLSKLADQGLSYNTFHTTAICSPTRAALLTGRNHQRVGNGTIAERAVDWDGYTGVIPKTSATMAEVLHHYGYKTAAFGKWHNTPADQTTAMGPFDRWPTGHGFDYFYGFLAGETSQWEPRLVENTTAIEPPHDKNYHLSEDMAQRSIDWLRKHRAFSPDKPFFLYWAPGAAHGPHQVGKEWSEKYKGKFDTGWDAYRERVFARQKQLGWIPANTKLTPRTATMPAWDSIPAAQRPFQLRLMEIYAGFVEHVDAQVGKVIDELERLGVRENTIVIYIFGDNGASAEGQNGTISELLAQNGIPNTVEQQIAALNTMGGLDLLGGPKTDSMYHAGWAWAGNTPFQYTKLIASHFGGTRNPMVISWPKGIKPDKTPRAQFHHVNDIAPTLYELIGIKPPTIVDGFKQDPIDGVSLAYTFANAKAPTRKKVQYFDNNGSRAIFQDGWLAATFGPLVPWLPGAPGLAAWDSAKDQWELYNLNADFSEADDLAAREPQRLAQLQKTFDQQAVANKVYPLGAGIWLRLHPEDRIKTPYTSWQFDATTTRMPEFTAPGLGRESNTVSIDAELKENASGVLYALGGSGGGLSLYLDKGQLVYEYNTMIIERAIARSKNRIPAGTHRIEVTTTLVNGQALSPAEVVLNVDGQEVARTTVKRTVPGAFSASETFDVGVDLGSTVSLDYFERRPFRFDGTIHRVDVKMN